MRQPGGMKAGNARPGSESFGISQQIWMVKIANQDD